MKRYYLSKIFLDESGEFPVWRHQLQTYPNTDYQGGEIKVDPETGIPTEKALLVLVGAKDHTPFEADEGLVAIPMGRDGLRVKVMATDTLTKLDFRARSKGIGFDDADVESITENTRSWLQVVNDFGQKNNPAFDANNFDLDES